MDSSRIEFISSFFLFFFFFEGGKGCLIGAGVRVNSSLKVLSEGACWGHCTS